ncbi:hypothetical protein OAT60_01360 [Luminiphilus sp.]|nr:hypothetical protein [Luminiphilus sp.]
MKLVLLELNEINFDVVNYYLEAGRELPGFRKVVSGGLVITEAEDRYENLEPWIQWPSVHTGKVYEDHKVFRLGDFPGSNHLQFFERIEQAGYIVGAISPMNAANALKKPAYFIPDPWTRTPCDSSFLSKRATEAIVQAVNDNSSSKVSFRTICNLGLLFLTLIRPSRYIFFIRYALGALGKPWRKALFLDLFLYEIHKTLHTKKRPNFSTLFLNAGAHIQHHYFFNSPFIESTELRNPDWYIDERADPILEMLEVYDSMLLDLLSSFDTELIVATGLSQKPYEQLKYYYRLRDHESFLRQVGVQFKDVFPRMTRDFLITFDTAEQARTAESMLADILVDNKTRLFAELDNRGKEIFVVLTYPAEVDGQTKIDVSGSQLLLSPLVTFVAIKNGEHQSKGFAYFSSGLSELAPPQGSHVSKIYNSVIQFFGI